MYCSSSNFIQFFYRYAGQISATASLEAGKYYYITALQKGTESTDSLSAGVRLPSGRFMRPVSKEVLQWRLPGMCNCPIRVIQSIQAIVKLGKNIKNGNKNPNSKVTGENNVGANIPLRPANKYLDMLSLKKLDLPPAKNSGSCFA